MRELDQLWLRHGTVLLEPRGVKDAERLVGRGSGHGVRDDPCDGGRDHEAVSAEAGGDVEPVSDTP